MTVNRSITAIDAGRDQRQQYVSDGEELFPTLTEDFSVKVPSRRFIASPAIWFDSVLQSGLQLNPALVGWTSNRIARDAT